MSRYVAYMPAADVATRVVGWSRLLAQGDDSDDFTFACAGGTAGCAEARAALGDDDFDATPIPETQSLRGLLEHLSLVKAEGLVTALRATTTDWSEEVDRVLTVLRAPSCETFLDLGGPVAPEDVRRVLVVLTGSAHDEFAVRAGARIAERSEGSLTVARIEPDVGEASIKLGERALDHVLHAADVDESERLERKVVVDSHPIRGMLASYDEHDLVIVGMGDLQTLRNLGGTLTETSLAVVKRIGDCNHLAEVPSAPDDRQRAPPPARRRHAGAPPDRFGGV